MQYEKCDYYRPSPHRSLADCHTAEGNGDRGLSAARGDTIDATEIFRYSNVMKQSSDTRMMRIMSNPKYRGKHLVVVAGRVFVAKTGKEVNSIIDKLEKKYPDEIPAMTYIPKADTLILWR